MYESDNENVVTVSEDGMMIIMEEKRGKLYPGKPAVMSLNHLIMG